MCRRRVARRRARCSTLLPELIVFSDERDTFEQHTTFVQREEKVRGKMLALNIRRLPAWILSREQHKARWGVHPDYKPIPMDVGGGDGESSFPDYRLSGFVLNGLYPIDAGCGRSGWPRTSSPSCRHFSDVAAERRSGSQRSGP